MDHILWDLEHVLQLEIDRKLMLVIEISTVPVLTLDIELGLKLEYVFVVSSHPSCSSSSST